MRIAVLLSGGVDSSLALALLQEAGHDVTAFYLKIWLEDELSFLGTCPWEEDLSYARAVCEQRRAPLEVIPFQQTYHERIVSYVIDAVKAGRTPNPDMLCNREIKFGAFLQKVGYQFDKVATGHYAQVREQDGRFRLFCSPDPIKDQTYFLACLSQQQLSHALFPIGHLTKEEVRQAARERDLPTAKRPDSQGICFLGKLKFADFVRAQVGEQAGDLIEFETRKTVGTHPGFWFYTIGQRQGIGLSGGPWYVVAKDPKTNRVFISKSYHSAEKERKHCVISSVNLIADEVPLDEIAGVKLRHGPQRHRAAVSRLGDDRYEITLLDESDQGIAPGQFAVLYRDGECLGGGVIDEGALVENLV